MVLDDAVVIVTGAAGGIGAAMCRAAVAHGARAVIAADLEPARVDALGGARPGRRRLLQRRHRGGRRARGDHLVAAGHAPAALQSPDFVAEAVLEGLATDRFLLLPDPDVATYAQCKAADPERWLSGMRRFRSRTLAPQDELGNLT